MLRIETNIYNLKKELFDKLRPAMTNTRESLVGEGSECYSYGSLELGDFSLALITENYTVKKSDTTDLGCIKPGMSVDIEDRPF